MQHSMKTPTVLLYSIVCKLPSQLLFVAIAKHNTSIRSNIHITNKARMHLLALSRPMKWADTKEDANIWTRRRILQYKYHYCTKPRKCHFHFHSKSALLSVEVESQLLRVTVNECKLHLNTNKTDVHGHKRWTKAVLYHSEMHSSAQMQHTCL